MTDPLLAFLIKLPLALVVFLLIAYAGTANRRIAGVLFTFPILNGVAIITSTEPVTVANAIYPLVIFNCVLFALVISWPRMLPPVSSLSRGLRLGARVVGWAAIWLAGGWWLTDIRNVIPGGGVLLAGSIVVAVLFMIAFWSGASTTIEQASEAGRANFFAGHAAAFGAFWLNRTGAARVVFFTLAYACLFLASRVALDEKWVGMASALPLPGFFALASLIDNAEDNAIALTTLRQIRDTLFLGPVLVIPFNWAFSHLLTQALPPGAFVLHYLVLLAMWMLAAFAVVTLVPQLSARLDRGST